ncbi:MAG: ATP-binding protein [Paracoccaceae bacterium]
MFFDWLKQYMPSSLYARAAIIIVMPVVIMQLVVSVVFIQRHLEDVTIQMTQTVIRELRLIASEADTLDTQAAVMERISPYLGDLNMRMQFLSPDEVPDQDQMDLFDYSARVVAYTMRNGIEQTRSLQFFDNKQVEVVFGTRLGPLEVAFDRRRVTVTAPHQLLVTVFFFGLLLTIISFLYMRNQLRPIKRLARASQQFGRGRVEPFRPAGAIEVRQAGSAFLDMRARIERQIEQRTMMLSGVSHDLRSPLTRLRLGLEMIDDAEAKPMLQDIEEMQQLIDAFLEFARDSSEGQMEETDPCDLVRRVVDGAQREGKDVHLGLIKGEGELQLRPTAVRRALENLVGNAVRYGTKARVSCVMSDKSLRIRVEDDGPGIAPEDRGDAIKPFTRLDPARNQNKGSGVGLGLAIVADIARAHGGTLRLGESTDMGGLQADIVIAR